MKRSKLVQIAHDALTQVNRDAVYNLINGVNLSKIEREIIIASEIEGVTFEEIADIQRITLSAVRRSKRIAMEKIAIRLNQLKKG